MSAPKITEPRRERDLVPIRRALISVSDKSRLEYLARALGQAGVEIVSTGSTAQRIRDLGIAVTDAATVTGFPEMLDGRVKTLHPAIHAGLLADLRLASHEAQIAQAGIAPFDLVVVNLYPFAQTVAAGATGDDVIEQIDIGGPAMVRAAAKNHANIAIVTSPEGYDGILAALAAGGTTLAQRRALAAAAFAHTAAYDTAVAAWFAAQDAPAQDAPAQDAPQPPDTQQQEVPPTATASMRHASMAAPQPVAVQSAVEADAAAQPAATQPAATQDAATTPGLAPTAELTAEPVTPASDAAAQPALPQALRILAEPRHDLRYGENSHQQAALYPLPNGRGLAQATQLHGKAMSYNNYVDADAAVRCAFDFAEPAVAIIKHANPCGIAVAPTDTAPESAIAAAHRRAHATDPVSAFGGVVAANREVSAEMAQTLSGIFTEVVVAPSFAPEAREILQRKANIRLLQLPEGYAREPLEYRHISGGILAQTSDTYPAGELSASWQLACGEPADAATLRDLEFAWRAVRAVKSNAILLAHDGAAVGVGMGQVNRVDSCHLAVTRAGERAAGAVAASDAFFPFADGVQVLIDAGVRAVAQPGGSIRDDEVRAAAEAAGLTMYFTGERHFFH